MKKWDYTREWWMDGSNGWLVLSHPLYILWIPTPSHQASPASNLQPELVHHIVDIIRNNITVDWSKRSGVRAKLRLTARKTLVKYGYSPNLAKAKADRVIEQSELLADSLTKVWSERVINEY